MSGGDRGREGRWQRIYAVVRRIPPGRVATYGQVAERAGLPRAARQVGYALHALRGEAADRVPWQRVINARGEVSARREPGMERAQRALLEGEGVAFDARGRVDLARFGWRPSASPRSGRAASRRRAKSSASPRSGRAASRRRAESNGGRRASPAPGVPEPMPSPAPGARR